MTFAIDEGIGAGDRTVPHHVKADNIDWIGYCGDCGAQVTTDDGGAFWHHDERLNPDDSEAAASATSQDR